MAHKIYTPVSALKWEGKCENCKLTDKWELHSQFNQNYLSKQTQTLQIPVAQADSHLGGMCTCRVIDCSSWTDRRRRVWATWPSFLFFLFPQHSGCLPVQTYFALMGIFKKITACTYENIALHSTECLFSSVTYFATNVAMCKCTHRPTATAAIFLSITHSDHKSEINTPQTF